MKPQRRMHNPSPGVTGAIDMLAQFMLPILTTAGFLFTAQRNPQIGLIFNLCAQCFWVYSGWQAWHKAKQIGIFITSIIITVVVLYGVLNYWVFH